ncbi:hypothetical protein ACHAWF_012729 [Thalassiosira exigua]
MAFILNLSSREGESEVKLEVSGFRFFGSFNLAPQSIHRCSQGDPVSALAVEEGDDGRPSLLYVASHTSRQGEGSGSRGAWTSGSSDADYADPHRGSRMTVLYDDDGADDDAARGGGFYGGRSVYSSFSAHPEARAGVLDGLHSVLFGGGSDVVPDNGFGSDSMRHAGRIRARPSHAYGPPFGPPRVGPGAIPPHRRAARPPGGAARPEEEHRMGVASVFPVSFGGSREGAACTVSPHGVRIHSLGGAVLADRSDESLRGSTCGISAPGGRHATVGGMSFPKKQGERRRHVHCVDLQRDLATVSSHSLQPYRDSRGGGRAGGGEEREPCVAALAADVDRGTLAAACADGTVRVLDGRGRGRCAEVARARAQPGGCAGVAVSGNLICAAGYATPGLSTPSSPYPYPFPASHVLIYDVRYLGRGGTPHVFSANRGGPRFVNFLPDIHMEGVERLLVGSGQTFGSFEVITPFEQAASGSTFFQPALTPGESMTTVKLQEGSLYCGTSLGRVLQYGLREYDRTVHAVRPRSSSGGSIGMSPFKKSTESDSFGAPAVTSVPREPLDVPSMIPQPPELSIDPAVLCASPDPRGEGAAGGVRGWNVFDAYILASEPLLSSQGAALPPRGGRNGSPGAIATTTTLGPLSTRVLVPPSARWLSKDLATRTEDGGSGSGTGEPRVFPTSSLGLKNLMSPDVVDNEKEEDSNGKRQARNSNRNSKAVAFPNPNKFLYALGPFEACYDANMTRRSHAEVSSVGHLSDPTVDGEVLVDGEENAIPLRYRLTSRPLFRGATSFNHVSSLGLWPGWDYGPTFHNAFASSVLTLLFFVGEIREAALGLQLRGREMVMGEGGMVLGSRGASITAELGRLFHWMKCLSVGSIVHPGDGGGAQVRAFAPLNFLAAFTELPEATNLALVDGVAGSAEIARRPEAFYRFLMQYIDRELGQIVSQRGSLVDRLQGLTFISIIEYARAPAKLSSSRVLTVDLSYDLARVSRNQGDGARAVRFGEILRASLCREAPLRAWCEETRSYEAVVQRRIATGLPTLLSLSCCCAGRGTNAGLECWQQDDIQQWLPELVEVRIGTDGAVTVRELAVNDEGGHEWMTFEQSSPLLSKELLQAWEREMRQDRIPVAKYYRLDAVVSFVRADPGASNGGDGAGVEGHHVVHVRALAGLKKGMLEEQLQHVESCMEGREHGPGTDERLTLVSDVPLQERCEQVQEELRMLQEKEGPKSDQWLLFNGNNVTTVELDDVRSFNVKFKEPSIVLFRETTDVNQDGCRVSVNVKPSKEVSAVLQPGATVPVDALITTSITNGRAPIGISGKLNWYSIDIPLLCRCFTLGLGTKKTYQTFPLTAMSWR